jgi:hypothetical protein
MPNLDVEVTSLFVNVPASAATGVPFQLTAQMNVRNNGPVMAAVVDTTFAPTLAAGCSASTGAMTVQNTLVPLGSTVFISRSWMVTCASTGPKTFDTTVSSILDVMIPAVDPNLANNTMSGSDSIQVN